MREFSKGRLRLGSMVALTAATALLAVGCSSSSGGGGSSAAASDGSTSGSGPTGSAIKIGMAIAQTGSAATLYSSAPAVADAWAKSVNAAGGIGGHRVQIVVRDTKSDAAAAASAAAKLAQSDKVVASFVLDSVNEASVTTYLAKQNVPVIGFLSGAGASKITNVFSSATNQEAYAPGIVVAAKAAGKKNFGNMYCAESPQCALAAQLYGPVSKGLGIKFLGGSKISFSAPDYTAPCLQLINKKTDYLELDVAPATAQRVAQACSGQGFKGVFGEPASVPQVKTMTKISGAKFAGPLQAFPWWSKAAAPTKYRSVMKKYGSNVDLGTQVSSGVWTALELFEKAVGTPTGAVTAASVITAYGTVKNETLDGLLPEPLTFTAGKPGPAVNCFWMYEYKAGDDNPTTLPAQGKSGNGQTGDLATTCWPLTGS